MSKQDGTPSSTKQRRSRKTNTANQENGKQIPAAQRPAEDDKVAWCEFWEKQGQEWRSESEIDEERRKYLTERRSIKPNIEQGIYPFKDIKLSRADIEWLLATHENGRGPIDWSDASQRKRTGLDLRGADLRRVDLQSLPLSRMRGGLTPLEWEKATTEQREKAAIHLEGANMRDARLNETAMRGAHLEGANLRWIRLEGAALREAHLEGVNLRWGSLKGAFLQAAHLEGADLYAANLEGANLSSAFFDSGTYFRNAILGNKEHGFVMLTDAHWRDANLAVVKWSLVDKLGDEYEAKEKKRGDRLKEKSTRLDEYEKAVRANRQLAVALQGQGLNEDANRFAYRAQLMQRVVLRRQNKFGQYLFSGFLDLLAGYGYRPGRSVLWYLGIIALFAMAYHLFGGLSLYPPDAFVYSLTSFHGRGFFPGLSAKPSLHDPLILLAALEAVIGLFIEISFIATFTQRFFGK